MTNINFIGKIVQGGLKKGYKMLMRILDPILDFFSSLGKQEENDDKINATVRPYIGKDLWLAMTPDRSRVLFTARTPKILQAKADAKGIQNFISLRAPRKLRPS